VDPVKKEKKDIIK